MRGELFMAESLTHLLKNVYVDKEIAQANKTFKKLEDVFGEIDYYDGFYKEFSKNKAIPKSECEYFLRKRDRIMEKLNEKLLKKGFYQDKFHELNNEFKINFNDAEIVLKLQADIKDELLQCANFFLKFPQFTDMEKQVHEIRRKIRWISIYAQSMQGTIVLQLDPKIHSWEKQFVTKTQISSPYNKLPKNKTSTTHIQFNKKAFYALNHVVSALGEIKDKAFAIEALKKCIKKTTDATADNEIIELVNKQLKPKYTEAALLKEAHVLLEQYFVKYKIHQVLV